MSNWPLDEGLLTTFFSSVSLPFAAIDSVLYKIQFVETSTVAKRGTVVSFQFAEDALKNLKEALAVAVPSKLERDGTIQRFEYSYELIWKLASRVLKANEVTAEVPKAVFRELGRLGWIDNVEHWLKFQLSRSETSHEYGEKLAQKSYELAKVFLPLAEDLLQSLKRKTP